MNSCPKCGGKTGLQTTHRLKQFYKWDGEPNGYEFIGEGTATAVCCDCGKRFKLEDSGADASKDAEGGTL